MTTPIPRHDEYRAIIEDVEFRYRLVAKGDRWHCETSLAEWLERNPLQLFTTAYVLRVVSRIEGPPFPAVACGQETP